ncbi:MAG: glutaminyl-peptide cyclotransferase [Chloroflexota bacterium]
MYRTVAAVLLLTVTSIFAWPMAAQPVCSGPVPGATVPVSTVQVLERYPHDPRAFTQGLTIADGQLYEGTGWFGESNLRRVDLLTGSVLQQVDLPRDVFGEGIAVVGNRIMQITWRSHLGYVYDRDSFALLGTFGYPTEGWGLTYDGTRMILSDGSDTLRFIDPDSFAPVGDVQVRAGGQPVKMINELEYIDGLLFANIWQTDRIALIDPNSGEVCAWLDLSGLDAGGTSSRDDVLNGIAFDSSSRRLFVTGKRWSALYEIAHPLAEGANPTR